MDEGILVEPVPFDLGVHERPDQVVVLAAQATLLDDSCDVVDIFDERGGGTFDGGGVGRALALQHVVGPAQQVVTRFGMYSEKVTDGNEGQWSRYVAYEVALPPLADIVEDVVADLTQPSLARTHALGGESLAHETAPSLVLGGVHVDHHRQRRKVRTDPSRARIGRRILGDILQVAVPGDPPHTVTLVEVGRGVASHPGECRKRVAAVERPVDEVDVDRGRI